MIIKYLEIKLCNTGQDQLREDIKKGIIIVSVIWYNGKHNIQVSQEEGKSEILKESHRKGQLME